MANWDYRIAKRVMSRTFLLAFLFLVGACGTTANSPSSTSTMQGKATLSHSPVGTSNLTWDAATQTLTVKVALSGLAPHSTHPEHIHAGNCNVDGPIVYTLNPLVADGLGVGTAETTITGVKKGIPESGWYLNVHNGPELSSPLQVAPIACANVSISAPLTKSNQSVHLTLGDTIAADESATGTAQLDVANGKMTVTVTISGLAPNSTHIVHIHTGTCEAQGGVLYPLNSLVADANGKATSTTVVNNVSSIPSTGWYVNVHLGSTSSSLNTQTGLNPIVCGNVVKS